MFYKLLFLLALTTVFGTPAIAQQPTIDPAQVKGYTLGPGDELEGKVLGEKDYDFKATVNEDGMIEVPFSEKPVVAKCRTERELREALTDLLKHELKNPQLNLRISERRSRPPASIYGAVNAPLQVTLMRKVTLIEMLSFAGGLKEEAGGMVQIFRSQPPICTGDDTDNWKKDGADADPASIPTRTYSLTSVRNGTDGSNPIIYPGDVIVVEKAAPVYITGEVIAPQGIYLKERGLSLSEALAQIGGPGREAKTKDIKIYRLKANTSPDAKDREVISANYDLIKKGQQKDVILQPFDIVEVGKSKKSIAELIVQTAIGAARSTITAGATNVGYRVIY